MDYSSTHLFHTPFMDSKRTSMSSIATNHIELRHIFAFQKGNNLFQIKPSARGPQNRSTLVVNILNQFGCQFDGTVVLKIIKAMISALDSIDGTSNSIGLLERPDDFANYIVQSRA